MTEYVVVSRDTWFPMGRAYKYRDVFAWFKTMWRKQKLVTAFGIEKENWG